MTAEKIYNALLECWADQYQVTLKGVSIEKKNSSSSASDSNADASDSYSSQRAQL